MTAKDMQGVARSLTDSLRRAARARRDGAGYDWWKVHLALFPNSDVTHAAREKWPDLDERIGSLFASTAELPGEECVFCGLPASARWAKAYLPMFDTTKALNALPPDGLGWPICTGCRVAMWALPYGAAVTAGSATVLTCGSDSLEQRFVGRNVKYAKRIRASGFASRGHGSPERYIVANLRTIDLDDSATLWIFKNDNQEPWIRVAESKRPIARFVRGLEHDPAVLRGWQTLGRVLTRRDRSGQVVAPGLDRAARTLFEPTGPDLYRPPQPALLWTVFTCLTGPSAVEPARDRAALTALARHYVKEMLEMDPDSAKPVAELLARWIQADKNPRGRFNDYTRKALNRHELGRLLMAAEARLLLDGKPVPVSATDAMKVIDATRNGAHLRMLLFFAVVEALPDSARTAIGRTAGEDDAEEDLPVEAILSSGDDENEEEGMGSDR